MAFPISGFYNARQPGSDVVNEKLEQLITMVGRQQEVILDFSRENNDLRSSLDKMESHVQSLGSKVSLLKESVAPSSTKKQKTKGRVRVREQYQLDISYASTNPYFLTVSVADQLKTFFSSRTI